MSTGINGTMLQGFSWNLPADGQHWRRLGQLADRLVGGGITSVWMPPAYKAASGAEDVGYGAYDLWDLGEFDQKGSVATKYGTRKEYVAAVAALQEAGIDVIGDVVLNHKMGADESEEVMGIPVAPDNRLHDMGPAEPITTWTRFTFPGRAGELDDFVWDASCFKGADYDAATDCHGLWLFEGKGWDSDVGQEYGNFDYLMGCDVDFNNPAVYDQLVKWGVWYVQTTGVDGLRLDAVKHMSRQFYLKWLADVRKATGKELFCVGEYWDYSADALEAYLGGEHTMSLFDVPLHFAFFGASHDRDNIDFVHMLDSSFVSRDPVHTVTFVDNHDTQPNQSLESTVQHWFKPVAYSIILLREAGYPCVFFADLFGLPNDAIPAVAELPLLMEVRRRFAYGVQHDYLDEPDLAGWTREGDEGVGDATGVAVILCSRRRPDDWDQADPEPGFDEIKAIDRWATKTMYVGTQHAGETWQCVLGDVAEVTIDEQGMGTFPASDSSMVTVFLPQEAANRLDNIPIVVKN